MIFIHLLDHQFLQGDSQISKKKEKPSFSSEWKMWTRTLETPFNQRTIVYCLPVMLRQYSVVLLYKSES